MRRAAGRLRWLQRLTLLLLAGCLVAGSVTQGARARETSPRGGFLLLAHDCAPNVDPYTLSALVRTESGFNPFAIGVVGAHLERQPASLAEALATVRELEAHGFSYSVGLAQVNNRNFGKYGENAATLFEPCRNLHAGAAILAECFARSSHAPIDQQTALRAALSCYYSGNFTTGFSAGYVRKVVTNARLDALQGAIQPIPVIRESAAPQGTKLVTPAAAANPADSAPLSSNAARPFARPVSDLRHVAPSCHAHPLVTVCHGLSAAQIRSLCVRCLDAR
ncbi:lytic transglycosylase domain-containing protein [Paraburkholderia megapolitana]|uniref:lytic transglycosylase domain-containing protein n=1 Tax=Paraburkholderia megapolitana TaxID=420953 RepID=UPI0038B865B0